MERVGEIIDLTDEQQHMLEHFVSPDYNSCSTLSPQHLIIILVESLESWALEKEITGAHNMPFLRSFIQRDHVLYCDKVTSEARKGNSGDGQMTVVTGLLPIQNGAACALYGSNTFPNLPHFFPEPYIVNPCLHEWNQDSMTLRYEIKHSIEPQQTGDWQDREVLEQLTNIMSNVTNPTFALAITTTSHTPFFTTDIEQFAPESTKIPVVLRNYLTCLNYTDACIETCVE